MMWSLAAVGQWGQGFCVYFRSGRPMTRRQPGFVALARPSRTPSMFVCNERPSTCTYLGIETALHPRFFASPFDNTYCISEASPSDKHTPCLHAEHRPEPPKTRRRQHNQSGSHGSTTALRARARIPPTWLPRTWTTTSSTTLASRLSTAHRPSRSGGPPWQRDAPPRRCHGRTSPSNPPM